MLTVYIGESPICFVDESFVLPKMQGVMYTSYSSVETMKLFVEMLEKNKEVRFLIVRHSDPVAAFAEFSKGFRLIEAAGGVVHNAKGEVLLIFRNGKWDLPKGKIESGEETEKAAIREVMEECGIDGLKITRPLPATYHTYRLNSEHILKRTYWFEMMVGKTTLPVPQLEEGITVAKWMNETEVKDALQNTFPSVKDVFKNKLVFA